jgi:tetratricopeptide (TPR) repeat protein
MISIVLHPDVIKFLRTDIDSDLCQKTWNCIDQLRLQQFSGGLRVKHLKGISKRVWEARINRASRLIFTYNKSRQPETGNVELYIAIQDICKDHDDVSRKAARERTPDATWLDAEVINTLGKIEADFTELPLGERNDLQFAQLEDQDLDFASSSEYNVNNVDELLGNIQWLIINSPEDWQKAIINQDRDIPIKLTPEEYALATRQGDIILKGCAGTGKTTVAIYRLFHDYLQYPLSGQRLYVACNPLLVSNVEEQFYRLLDNKDPEAKSLFKFKTLRDLCLEILQQCGQIYSPEDEVNFYVFEKIYLHQASVRYPTALVWDEIRSIIKGGQLALDTDYLTLEGYEELGAKRSSVVAVDARNIFYSRFVLWYRNRLRGDKRFDEIDLTRRALQVFTQQNLPKYELVVCDEVQDFTELQLEFLMHLVTRKGSLFFAGDIHQIISPSGFRWGDLTTRFYEHGRSQPIQEIFTFNFRSIGSLVNLANQVLQLRYRLLNESSPYKNAQAIDTYGELTRLVVASSKHLESVLETLHPGDAILVRTNVQRDHLRDIFKSTLVFTIQEAKGLEFDTVFLVDFFQHKMELWQAALQKPQRLQENQIPGLILELNLLYVAVTRARRILNVWEEHICEFWQQPELIDNYTIKDMQTVAENRYGAKIKDWQERGEYYLKAEFYPQAAECFEKSGDNSKRLYARAKQLQKEGKYQGSAEIFVQLKDWEIAAQLFQRIQMWQEAASCWKQVGDFEQEQICKINLLEEQKQFLQAAKQWEAMGRHERAAQLFEKVKQWEDAAQQWHLLGKTNDEKRCWMESSNEPKKAEYLAGDFEKRKQWLQAFEQYELAGLNDKAAEIRPKAVTSLIKSGIARSKQFNYAESVEDYTQALRLDSNNAEAYLQRGLARAGLKEYTAAIEDYNQALRINSNNTKAYLQRGLAKSELKEYTAAIEDYNQALRINPQYAEVYNCRGKAYQMLSQLDIQKARLLKANNKLKS